MKSYEFLPQVETYKGHKIRVFTHECRTCPSGFKYKALITGLVTVETKYYDTQIKALLQGREIIDNYLNRNHA